MRTQLGGLFVRTCSYMVHLEIVLGVVGPCKVAVLQVTV